MANEAQMEMTVRDQVLAGIRTWPCHTALEWKEKATDELVLAHIALNQARRQVESLEAQVVSLMAAVERGR